ncbi:MAG: EAL domain-containing protein [Lachnospiraceae bacterium]
MSLTLDQEQYHEFYDAMDGGICIIQADENEEILFVNRSVPELYGCRDEAEFYKRTGGIFAGMTKESDREPLSLHVVRGAKYSTWYYQIPEAGGSIRPAQMLITCAVRENTPVFICQIFTEAMHKASLMSDGLTGLPGVKEFTASTLELLKTRRGEKVLGDWCCLYFNVTNFRFFNRSYGVEAGDRLIKEIAETLQSSFPDGFVGHLSADNFAAIVRRKDVDAGIQKVTDEIQSGIHSKSIQLKTGIFLLEDGADDDTLRTALDRARLACDSISQDATQYSAVYSSKMQEESEKRTYLLNHFESALAEGDIHVYYQPVVRTLTGKLCSFEALARWEDPEKGMISPMEFVPLLEEVHLIGKLDAYIIENVCRLLHERLQNGHRILPVSVNLSKLDFDLIHPLELLENLMDRYDLPRESIHVEITETVMAWDREKLAGIIRDFHAAGFEVWLDDFGSEYSSLNALHYFQFDVLKIDMEFFRNFDERGRKIIKSVVMMAKSLGILTLAEGVENEQQLEFLRSIGCGRIQGWYYGKPEPFSVVMEQMTCKGITSETDMERRIFYRVGLVNTVTEKPVAIFAFNGNAPTLLTANEVYLNVLRSTGTLDQKMANGNLASGAWGPQKKICSFLEKVYDGKAKSMTYVDNGHYIMVTAEKIAGTRDLWYGKASLVDLGGEGRISQARLLDNLYRNVLDIFDGIYYLDYEHDRVHIYSSIHGEIGTEDNGTGVDEQIRAYARELVHVDDRERFLDFLNKDRLCDAAQASGRSEATGLFRIHREDGRYHWSVFHAIVFFKHPNRDVLLLEREDIWERKDTRKELLQTFASTFPDETPAVNSAAYPQGQDGLFTAMTHSEDLKFFWVDRTGAVQGMSDAFRAYSGLSLDAVRGRTGKTIPFFLDIRQLVQQEKEVLRTGRELAVPCTVIRNGTIHQVRLTGIPYYQGNETAGIICLLTDAADIELAKEETALDPATKFLNFRGVFAAGAEFDDALRVSRTDYCVLNLVPRGLGQLSSRYGISFLEHLEEILADAISQTDLSGVVVGRIQVCSFILMAGISNLNHLKAAEHALEKTAEEITDVDGIPCRIVLESGLAYGVEGQDFMNVFTLAAKRRLESNPRGEGLVYPGEQVLVDMGVLADAPEYVMIIDPASLRVLYMNPSMRQALGMSMQENVAERHCYDVLAGRDTPCETCHNSSLAKNRVVCWNRRWKGERMLLNRDFLIPWHGSTAVMSIGIPMSEYIRLSTGGNVLLLQENGANEAIESGLSREDPGAAIQSTLQGIARSLRAERVLILEKNPSGSAFSCTHEWHREGFIPAKAEMQSIVAERISPLVQKFADKRVVLISDYPAFARSNPTMRIPIPNIKNMVSGQLMIGGKPMGMTMVINSSKDTFRNASLLLLTLTDFLAVLLRLERVQNQLQEDSYQDGMTGVGSRRGLARLAEHYDSKRSCAVLVCDVRNLNHVNAVAGIEAGNQLLKKTAATLARFADRGRIFRIDGDEFLIFEYDMDAAGAKLLERRILEEAKAQDIPLTTGCAVHERGSLDLSEIMNRAEHARLASRAYSDVEDSQ